MTRQNPIATVRLAALALLPLLAGVELGRESAPISVSTGKPLATVCTSASLEAPCADDVVIVADGRSR